MSNFIYPGGDEQVTPNLLLATWGMDEVLAQNMILIDAAVGGGSSSVKVNGSVIANPNFNGTTPAAPGGNTNVTFQVDGSGNISAYVPTSGTVTSFSAGNFDVVATTSVTNPTTTPALTFTLTTQAANSFWAGPTTGAAAAPTFRAIGAGDIPSGTVLLNQIGNPSGNTTINITTHAVNLEWTNPAAFITYNFQLGTTAPATSLSNINSPAVGLFGSYWTGSISSTNEWRIQDILGSGANPTTTLTISQVGSSGVAAVQVPNLSFSTPGAGIIDNTGSFGLAGQVLTAQEPGVLWVTPSASGGTVTSFSAGALSPLFTTSVATASTTPALTFALANAAQNSVFAGPSSGGAGAPSYRALVAGDIPSLAAIYLPLAGGTLSGNLTLQSTLTDGVASVGTGGMILSSTGTGVLWVSPGSVGASWSSITSATTNLTLGNGAFTTTFNQTAAVAWLWANTTANTTGTAQASPTLGLAANYDNAGTSTQDLWTIGTKLSAVATTPTSYLTLTHTGTGGLAQIDIVGTPGLGLGPAFIRSATSTTAGFNPATNNTGVASEVYCDSAGGSNVFIRFYQGGATPSILGGIATQTTAKVLAFGTYGNNSYTSTIIGPLSLTATATVPLVSLGVWNTSAVAGLTGIAGTLVGVSVGSVNGVVPLTGGNVAGASVIFSPITGSASFIGLNVNPIINSTAVTQENNITGVQQTTTTVTIGLGTSITGTAAYTNGAQINVAAVTKTTYNGLQTINAAPLPARAGSPYTITNSVENASSVVTLTIGTHSVVANDWVLLQGLTTATWLNNQFVKVTSVVANTSITFTDTSGHGTSATHADTGTVTAGGSIQFAFATGSYTGLKDTGTISQTAGNYTACLINATETAVPTGTNNALLDVQVSNVSKFTVSSKGHLDNCNGDVQGPVSSVSGTTVSVVYTTAYASTPTVVVTPTTNAGSFFLSASSSTGFTITYTTSGAQTFNYQVMGNPT
jgi:hypothetical protein